MKYAGITIGELTLMGGIHTAGEISQQPKLWKKIEDIIEGQRPAIQRFMSNTKFGRIILTGAGTSAFIGLSLRGAFQRNTCVATEAIATTDLVSHPHNYFHPAIPTLMVSFARSGNSPESVAAVKLADRICKDCCHLIITCNADGLLANYETTSKKYVLTLPAEANDQSLAMTSSYTGMLLTGKLIAEINDFERARKNVAIISKYAEKSISYYTDEIRNLAQLDFKRAVFLGSGPFFGTATEAALKLQELSDGKVICKSDSFLGLRHGPKAVIDETTLVVYIFSNDSHVQQYEKDLVMAMKKVTSP